MSKASNEVHLCEKYKELPKKSRKKGSINVCAEA